jgi:hypothetical protein
MSLVTFSGFDATSTAYDAALFINNHITYGSVEVVNNRLRVVSNILGTVSFVTVVGGTALSELGLAAGTGYGAYSINRDSGSVTIRPDQFVLDDMLAIVYTALEDRSVINQWYSFKVPQYLRQPVKYWRIVITDTWGGAQKELKEVELHGNEYYPRLYRHERIGLYLNFGSVTQGCTANVCNKPVTAETLAKIMRYSCTAIPAGYEMVLGVLDCHYEEGAYQRINLFEDFYDVLTPSSYTVDSGTVSEPNNYYNTIVLPEKPTSITFIHDVDDICVISPSPITIAGCDVAATNGFILSATIGGISGMCEAGWSVQVAGNTASGSGPIDKAVYNALCVTAGITVITPGTTLTAAQLQALGFDMTSPGSLTMYLILKSCGNSLVNLNMSFTY